MPSIKRLIYMLDSITSDNDEKYVSAKELSLMFKEENAYNRTFSILFGCKPYFLVKRIGRRTFWKLSKSGKKYLDIFIDTYDPVTDTVLMNPIKVELINDKIN